MSGCPPCGQPDSRNFLLTDDGVSIVGFDDLTLAPFGYDLAKLVVSTAMTHGHLDARGVDAALKIYNTHTAQAGGSPTTCAPEQLRVYTDLDAAPEPRNLRRLKAEIRTRWGTVPLIDMLKGGGAAYRLPDRSHLGGRPRGNLEVNHSAHHPDRHLQL